jgi:uncharacterized protein YggE
MTRTSTLFLTTLALAAPALAAEPAPAPAAPAPSTVRVQAESTLEVKPDLAEVAVGVTTEKPTAAAAGAENAAKMAKIIEALKKEVGAGGEVKTGNFNVSPRFGEPKPGRDVQPIVGYIVSNTVVARTRDVNAAGKLLDRAFQLGANNVERVSFNLKDPEAAQLEALKAAAAKARARATAMASGLGLRVGPVLSVGEGGGDRVYEGPQYGMTNLRARAAQNFATPIEAGNLEVRAQVTVVFALTK